MRTTNKKLLSLLLAVVMVLSLIPAGKIQVAAETTDAWAELDATLATATDDVTADCPACGTENATWNAISGNKNIGEVNATSANTHYYLSDDVDYTGSATNFLHVKGSSVCLHLNGKQLNTGKRILLNNNYEAETAEKELTCDLNIIDRVSGGGQLNANIGNQDAAIFAYNETTSNVTLYGGTYSSVGKPIVKVNGKANAETLISLKKDVVFKNDQDDVQSVMMWNSQLSIDGATVEGIVEIRTAVSATLSGAAKVEKIERSDGSKLTMNVSGLTQGAKIGVADKGPFTAESMGAYAQYFTTDAENCTIGVTKAGKVTVFDNSPLQFAEGTTKAYCPYCDTTATWTNKAAADAETDPTAIGKTGGHYYFSEDTTYKGTAVYMQANGDTTYYCLHLNGNNLRTSTRINVYKGIVSIMGTGTYTHTNGTAADAQSNAALYNHATGTLNLFGGTYSSIKGGSYAATPVVLFGTGASTAKVNLYGGTLGADKVVNGETTTNPNETIIVSMPKLATASYGKAGGTFNMYGGKIQNGVNTVAGGTINCLAGTFNLYGGEITGGNTGTKNGANVQVYSYADYTAHDTTFNMYGGKITNGKGGTGANLYIAGNGSIFNMYDGEISGGTATGTNGGGNLRVHGTTTANISGGVIKTGKANGKDNNVDLTGGVTILSGNAKISGGTDEGSGIALNGADATLILLDNATVVGNSGAYELRYPINIIAGVLKIDNNWTGKTAFNNTAALTEEGTIDTAVAYCGAYTPATETTAASFVQGGALKGTLKYWTGSAVSAFAEDGVLKVYKAEIITADGSTGYTSNEAAMEAYTTGVGYIKLNTSDDLVLTKDAYVDVNIQTPFIDNSAYSVGLMNTKNAFTDTTVKYIDVDNTNNLIIAFDNPAGDDNYYYVTVVDNNNQVSAHRVTGKIASKTLRTQLTDDVNSGFGMYYKATIKCDAYLASYIDAYGAVYNGSALPTNNFLDDSSCRYTRITGELVGNADNTFYSGMITYAKDAMDEVMNRAENPYNPCEKTAYAAPYIMIGDVVLVMDGDSCSINDLVSQLNKTYAENATFAAFVTRWADYVTVSTEA